MGIWIRSQNKCVLCNANTIWVDGEDVFANNGVSNYAELGEYDSEAEAIQVLDMIHTRICEIAYLQYSENNTEFVLPVFQMPPAGFSTQEKEE